MNKELQCNIVNDLLPLYMDDLTSEETNSFIKKHLEECQNCQNEYRTFQPTGIMLQKCKRLII